MDNIFNSVNLGIYKIVINILGTIGIVSFIGIAIYGSLNAHNPSIQINIDTRPYEIENDAPVMIELTPEPDYSRSMRDDIPSYIPMTEREIDLLIRIAQSEAGNQGMIGKALVMRVVLNRVEKNGTDIETEIYKPNQFAVAGMAPGNWESYEALDLVRSGWDESEGATYFCATGYNGPEPLFKYLGHYFSK